MKTISDIERLNWIEAHPSVHFDFHPFSETWHIERKRRFPAGYWSRRFGRKDFSNAFASLREVVDESIKRDLSEHVAESDNASGASLPEPLERKDVREASATDGVLGAATANQNK